MLVVAKQNNTLAEISLDIIQVPALKLSAVHYKFEWKHHDEFST